VGLFHHPYHLYQACFPCDSSYDCRFYLTFCCASLLNELRQAYVRDLDLDRGLRGLCCYFACVCSTGFCSCLCFLSDLLHGYQHDFRRGYQRGYQCGYQRGYLHDFGLDLEPLLLKSRA